MQTSRRRFLATGIGSLAATAFSDTSESTEGLSTHGQNPPLDYGLSFICNPAEFNAVRFWVESRTTWLDEQTGESMTFYQCGSCKSEHTFAKENLFHEDNYDFLPILGGDEWLIFRRPAYLSDRYREVRNVEKLWGKPILKLRQGGRVKTLNTWEQIRDATADAVPIVSQTEIANADTGLRAVIECPVKTMNVSLENRVYQVDTGPVALPDLTRRYEKPIESLSLAFLALNAPDFADFVVEQPTSIVEDGKEVTKVHHYSSPFSQPAKNRLLSMAPRA